MVFNAYLIDFFALAHAHRRIHARTHVRRQNQSKSRETTIKVENRFSVIKGTHNDKKTTKNSIFYHRHTFDIYQIHRFIMKEVRLRYFESGVGCFLTLLFFFREGQRKDGFCRLLFSSFFT